MKDLLRTIKTTGIASTLAFAGFLCTSLAHADELADGTITELATYSDTRTTFISAKVNGTSCSGGWVRFVLAGTSTTEQAHIRSMLQAAFLSGKSVEIDSSTGSDCNKADYVRIKN